ncbi:hypothetical protein BDZ91DRAFT_738117 [Kalaharituber pfeilii]|nr:hypothetical protein BDZ91DRAFT_738117 [Kalaharituber pfeilii]
MYIYPRSILFFWAVVVVSSWICSARESIFILIGTSSLLQRFFTCGSEMRRSMYFHTKD